MVAVQYPGSIHRTRTYIWTKARSDLRALVYERVLDATSTFIRPRFIVTSNITIGIYHLINDCQWRLWADWVHQSNVTARADAPCVCGTLIVESVAHTIFATDTQHDVVWPTSRFSIVKFRCVFATSRQLRTILRNLFYCLRSLHPICEIPF